MPVHAFFAAQNLLSRCKDERKVLRRKEVSIDLRIIKREIKIHSYYSLKVKAKV